MDLRIEWLINDTYQVVEYENGSRWTVWHQGSISDCVARSNTMKSNWEKATIKGLDDEKSSEVTDWIVKKYGSIEKMPSHTLELLAARLAS